MIYRNDLAEKVYERTGYITNKPAARAIVREVFKTLGDLLADGVEVQINHFGQFVLRDRAERTGTIPPDNKPWRRPAGRDLAFRPTPRLKKRCDHH